ncbi:MAG: hypothetical protein ABSG65_28525 [Bryobacteraceae bacterium]|jgi:hypothetical protein
MTIQILAVLGFGTGCLLLAADEPKQKVPVSGTQRMDLPPDGTLRLTKSTGLLTVEAWDRPDVEITTIKLPGQVPECRIKASANAKLIVDHDFGDVNIDGLAGDIQVTLLQGEILLHLPQDGRYNIHARSHFGAVNSDFPGPEKRRWWLFGHRSLSRDSQAAHKLNLRVAFGDIVILKTRVPTPPGPLISASKADGV